MRRAAGEAGVIGGKGWGLIIVPSLLPASIIPSSANRNSLHQILLFSLSSLSIFPPGCKQTRLADRSS